MLSSFKTKLVIFGPYVEVYHYTKAQICGIKRETRIKSQSMPANPKKFQFSINRTRNTVRRLISSNFNSRSTFLTLTFADNMQDFDEANRLFKKFVRSLRYRLEKMGYDPLKFKYLSVIEFQKRGAIHFHMIMNCPFLPFDVWNEIWPHGWFKLNRIKHVKNVGAYVSKYMRKDLHDARLRGKRSYQCSRNLNRPFEVIDKDFVRPVLSNLKRTGAKLEKQGRFDNEWTGKVHYRLYRRGGSSAVGGNVA